MFDVSAVRAPFAMRPGMQRLDDTATHFIPLDPQSPLAAEKASAWTHPNAWLVAEGFGNADVQSCLQAAQAQLRKDGIASPLNKTPEFIATNAMNSRAAVKTSHKNQAFALSTAIQEDFAVLDGRAASPHCGTVPLMCITCPSHWSPEEKIGLPLAQIHGPVADGEMLRQATDALVRIATSGQRWQRWVWTITPSPRFDAHPKRNPDRIWPATSDSTAFAQACFLRSERQTFFPVLGDDQQPSGLAIFTIGVQIQPLARAVATLAQANTLRQSLKSMSAGVLAYKGIEAAQAPLCRWLDTWASASV